MASRFTPTDIPAFGRARSDTLDANFNAIKSAFDGIPDDAHIEQGIVAYGTDTGAANAYVVTMPYTQTAYTDGMLVVFKAANANTGASTVNVDSLGVISVVRGDGSAIAAGDIPAEKFTGIRYNSTSGKFEIQSSLPNIASDAAASAAAAAASAAAAAASYDSFDDRYLGAKASDPATDNDGDALLAGAVYWNTTSGQWKVYTGSAWQTLPGGQIHVSDSRPSASTMQNGDTWIKSNYASGSAWAVYTIVDTGDSGKDALQAVVDISNGNWLSPGNSESIDVNCSAGGTITLSALENAYGVLNLTGTPGAPFNVVVDTSKRMRTTINGADGVATVKTSAGTGAPVAARTSRPLLCDGTNVVDPITGVSRYVMTTSESGFANYWAKLKTWTVPTSVSSSVSEEVVIGSFGDVYPASATVGVFFTCSSSGDLSSTFAGIGVRDISGGYAVTGTYNSFAHDGFMLVQPSAGTVELWVQRQKPITSAVGVYETFTANTDGVSSSYNDNASWQSAAPTGAVEVTSDSLSSLSVAANSDGNVARYVATTGSSGSGSAGYWAKLATIQLDGTESRLIGGALTISGVSGDHAKTEISYFIRTLSSGIQPANTGIFVESINNYNNGRTSSDGFMMTFSADSLSATVDIWVKTSGDFASYSVHEKVYGASGAATISYNNGATWQATTPTGALTFTSDWAGSGWITPTLLNGWTSSAGIQYRKYANGLVHIFGRLDPGTETNGTTIFTLPAGYRPKQDGRYTVTTNVAGGAGGAFNISSTGNFQMYDADTGGTFYSVNILFLAEN